MGELDGKAALITGGARGFGRACALVVAREGADVAVSDVLDTTATAVEIEALGRRALALDADVTSVDDCRRMTEDTIAELGKIDILVANAGITGPGGRAWELSVENWERMIAVDLTGVWLSTKYVVPHMIERGYGKIVMTASRSGVRAEENCAHYVAAKFGVVGYMKALAMELGRWEINVNAICPSGMGKISEEDYDPSQFGPPLVEKAPATAAEFDREYGKLNLFKSIGRADYEEVALGVLWLVSDRSRLMTGCALSMDGGYVAQRGG